MAERIHGLFRVALHGSKEFRDTHYNDLYDFYHGDDDDRPQTASKCQHHGRMVESFKKGEFTVYDQVARYSRPPSAAGSQVEDFSGISRQASPKVSNPLQALTLWKPPSSGKKCVSERSSTPGDVSRPVTAISAAGYCSRGSVVDFSSQGSRALSPLSLEQDEPIPDLQLREIENHVHLLLEESAVASVVGNHLTALEKAKDAGKKERILTRRKEHLGVAEMNLELTYSVCFNLGYQYQMYKLYSEALCTYSQIVKNNQDAVQSFEAVMEIKYDHQSCYNLIVCYYITGNREKMKSCFTKVLLVRHYDFDADDEVHDNCASYLQSDKLQQELQSRQIKAEKYILNAARLIAPNICNTVEEGYSWVIDILKDQQYVTLAQEIEMDKTVQQLYMHGSDQAVSFLKEFEKRESVIKTHASTNLSFICLLEQDVENAQKYAELAVEKGYHKAGAIVNQGNSFFLKIKWKFMVASCYKQIGRLSMALLKYKDILSCHPNNIECLRHLLLMCTSLGEKEAAHDFEDRLKKAERPGSPFRRESEKSEEKHVSSSNASWSNITMPCLTTSMKRPRSRDEWEIGDDLLPL